MPRSKHTQPLGSLLSDGYPSLCETSRRKGKEEEWSGECDVAAVVYVFVCMHAMLMVVVDDEDDDEDEDDDVDR